MPAVVQMASVWPASNGLPEGEVHVWCVLGDDIGEPCLLRDAEAVLDGAEIARAARFRQRPDRDRFVTGRGLLRRALGAYLGVAPQQISFAVNAHGRPELAAPATLRFNVSHTDGIVAAVFSACGEVGIDAERIRSGYPDMQVARRQFAPEHCADLEALGDDARSARFCEYWTLLEAYAKARGLGLSLAFRDCVFAFSTGDPAVIRFADASVPSAARWRFWLMRPTDHCRLAIAAPEHSGELVMRRLGRDGAIPLHSRLLASTGR